MTDLLVRCLILFCTVVPGTARCDVAVPFTAVELSEYATGRPQRWKSSAAQACEARFLQLREDSPAADERPIRFEVVRPRRQTEVAEGE